MQSLNPVAIAAFVASALLQVLAFAILPQTDGFSRPLPTAVVLVSISVAIGLLAWLLRTGANLSLLMPLLSATVPLALIAVGVYFYGESASLPKIAMLVTAAGMVGFASTL